MLYPETLRAVDGWWTGVFGCDETGLFPRHATIYPRPAGDPFRGMYAMAFGEAAPAVTVDPPLLPTVKTPLRFALAAGLDVDPTIWAEIFEDGVEAVVGPAAIRCADRGTFRPVSDDGSVRLLDPGDEPAVARLRAASPPLEWEHGGSEVVHPQAGAFVGDDLVALAGYEVWGNRIAHISVITHPAHRGRGLGTAVVSRIAALALDRRLVPQFRTLETNAPSIAIAERLGFEPYARSLAVRLKGGPAR
jgi:GNAT superfamily N-acetyltransferase